MLMFARLSDRIRPHLPALLLLLGATLLVYGRIIGHDFQVTWDDDHYIIENPMVHGLTPEHVRQAFAAQYFGNYAPLHLISYMLDFELWRLWPGGYLLTNLLIHAVNGLLFYRTVIQLHGQRLMATVAAAVFLLHPLQVESVAWASQRKNLLAMLFFLLAWEGYRRYREQAGGMRMPLYAASLLMYVCALLSKSVTVIFPLLLMLHDYCFGRSGGPDTRRHGEPHGDAQGRVNGHGRLSRPAWWLDKVPYILLTAAAVVVTVKSQAPAGDNWDGAGGGITGYHGGSPLATFYSMLPVFVRYLGLLVWPSGLNAQYSPRVYASAEVTVVAAGILLALAGWLMYRLFRYDRTLGFWAGVFCAGFLPVSQIVPLVTMMNDRYVYFPMLGFAALAGAGCMYLGGRLPARLVPALHISIFGLLALLSVAAYLRTGCWKDSVTLWSDSVAKDPARAMNWVSLAQAYERVGQGKVDEALAAYNRALALDPSNAYTLYGLGRIYGFTGQYDKALQNIDALLRVSPNHVMGWTLLGTVQERLGRYDQAESSYLRAAQLQPDAVEVAMQLANLSVLRGDLATAGSRYREIEDRLGKFPVVAYMLSWLALREGQREFALSWLEKALQRGYADYRSIDDLEELSELRGDPRFEQLLKQYGAPGGQR